MYWMTQTLNTDDDHDDDENDDIVDDDVYVLDDLDTKLMMIVEGLVFTSAILEQWTHI